MMMNAKSVTAALVIGLSFAVSTGNAAQKAGGDYPSRPVRWIVPFPPGASNDITARLFSQKMSESMGHQFVIDNRPGSGGLIAAQEAEPSRERRTQVGTGDRSAKIRTYNFPQNRVTDHRIGLTLHSLSEVLAGDLDALVSALRLAKEEERLGTSAP